MMNTHSRGIDWVNPMVGLLVCCGGLLGVSPGQAVAQAPSGVWKGQDGVDRVGPSPTPGGNQIQDIHIALSGLPRGRAITFIELKGYGGANWYYNGAPGSWLIHLEQNSSAGTAELYFEPAQKETGRKFFVKVKLDDGREAEIQVAGGPADPNTRTLAARVKAWWVGQAGDLAGDSVGVGPDGKIDAQIGLGNLSTRRAVRGVRLTGPNNLAWESGPNPRGQRSAEFVPDPKDASKGILSFQPTAALANQALKVEVEYDDQSVDVATLQGGTTDPNKLSPKPAPPRLVASTIRASWLGQDERGMVSIGLEDLPAGKPVTAAVLSDGRRTVWTAESRKGVITPEPESRLMTYQPGADRTRATLVLPPTSNLVGSVLTARLVFEDGTFALARLRGGACEPGKLFGEPAATATVAQPGSDLQALADQFGTIVLTPGTYELSKQLIFNKPARLIGGNGVVLRFSQPADAAPWTAAIKVHRGHTSIEKLAIRFAGPIRWVKDVSYGPAVIGATDNLDPALNPPDDKHDLVFENLDIEGPPPASPGEEAPRLFRLINASSGRIVANVLRGGCTEFIGGPWVITDNEYRGTHEGSVTVDAFAGHHTRDLYLARNRLNPISPSGKTWRFLVLTQSGDGDRIETNFASGLGPRDGDNVPDVNLNEVMLTEAYTLKFEGLPALISSDGQFVRLPSLAPGAAEPKVGDVVAVLAGPAAGEYRRVVQAIDPLTLLVDAPLPVGEYALSVAVGFYREVFDNNTIDTRGGSRAMTFVLNGNHFGTRVTNNKLLGGREVLLQAAATEKPSHWGWSHAPMFGLVYDGNVMEDSEKGLIVAVEHSKAIKSNVGRVYFTGSVVNSTIRWTSGFLSRQASGGSAVKAPLAATFGATGSLDPGELVLVAGGNRAVPEPASGSPSLWIHGATFNGQKIQEQGFSLTNNAAVQSPERAGAAVNRSSDGSTRR